MKVVDRRFWARDSDAGPEDISGKERSAYPKFVEELQAQLEDSRSRLRDLTAAYRQVQQEGEEVRLRLNRDLERRVSVAKGDMFCELLEVADNLERALGAAGSALQADDLARGVEQVLVQLHRFLQAQGVEEIDLAGQKFDPEVAEAIEVRRVEGADGDGKVVEVAQRGYRYAGRTLRAARVVVGRAGSGEGLQPGKD